MFAPERTLHDLRYPELLQQLVARCRTAPGAARAQARPFLASPEEVREALGLVEEARLLLSEPLALPLTGVSDLSATLERAVKGAMLEPKELQNVTAALFSFERTKETLLQREARLPQLARLGRELPDLEDLATELDRSFEPSGELSDRASPELARARNRTRGLHRAIKERIDELLRNEKFAANLREGYFTLRNDRYVLPVMTQHRAEVPGIVHNASQTGQTLFVEPQELIGMGNDLAIAQSVVSEEERRILQQLSGQVGAHAEEIGKGVAACARLDEAEGAARLSNELRSHALEPGQAVPLDLRGLRHPLLVLAGREVVANDVQLSSSVGALVISGPNAGGKTVTLTGVGLCALMARAGLPVPVEPGSRLPWFESVHSTIGDAQDLSQGLSTFSAHLLELRRILESAREGSLALIDEIAADTDPREGAALATAVLEELLGRKAVVLVTTHLEELKALAHVDGRFANARVGFDARKMAPTYRLQLGAAGASSAIDVAARMGLPAHLCERARSLALGTEGSLTRALGALEEERKQLSEQLERARAETTAAEKARAEFEAQERAHTQRRREEELRFRDALQGELAFAQEQVKQLLAQLRKKASVDDAVRAQRELKLRAEEQARAAERTLSEQRKAEGPPVPLELKPGSWVRDTVLDREVELLEVDGDEAVVAAGAMRMRVPVARLAAPRSHKPGARFPATSKKQAQLEQAQQAAPAPLALGSATCDVRGLRAEEALRDLEHFLDRLLREGEARALVLHGHGTGALKQSVRDYLGHSPYVQTFRSGDAEEGGDAVTVVSLRA